MRNTFADTSYWVAVTVPKDQWHSAAQTAKDALGNVVLVTTEEVLTEFLNMMSKQGAALRERAVRIVQAIYKNPNVTVVPQTNTSFLRGLERYDGRRDKQYSLTDCISMNVMDGAGIQEVLTNDHHFEQEGFTVLMKGIGS